MATMLATRLYISSRSVSGLSRWTIHRAVASAATTGASQSLEPARRWQSTEAPDTSSDSSYTLYQYRICPFSNIAKVYLKSRGIPYDEVEVNPLTKAELKFSKDGYKKVPILTAKTNGDTTEGKQLNGSESIIAYFENQDKKFSSNDDMQNNSNQLDSYARNTLAPLLYPNLCDSLSSSFNAFNYVHTTPNNFTPLQRYSIQLVGSVAMYLAASKVKKKHGIDDARKALEDELLSLDKQLEGREFLDDSSSTDNLSVGDLSIFGVLKGLEGLPISNEIMNDDRFSRLSTWYQKVDGIVGA